MGRDTGLLSPSLISPSSCITSVKFRRFTRNYHQHPSAPGLSEQVNDLSPGLCPRVTAITAGLLTAAKGLSRTSKAHTLYPAHPPSKAMGDHGTSHTTGSTPPSSAGAGSPPGWAPLLTCLHHLCGLDHPGMGYSENTEHSTSPSCQLRFLLGVSEGAQGLAQFKRAPASTGAAQGSCPVCKVILEPSDQGVLKCLRACQQLQQNPSGLAYLEGYFKPLPN